MPSFALDIDGQRLATIFCGALGEFSARVASRDASERTGKIELDALTVGGVCLPCGNLEWITGQTIALHVTEGPGQDPAEVADAAASRIVTSWLRPELQDG